MELCFSATPRAGATPPGAQVPRVWRGGWRDRDRVDRIAHNTTSKSKERAAVARGVWCGLWCECEWKGAMEQRETTSNGGAGDRDRDRRGLGPRPSDSDSASRQHFMYNESLELELAAPQHQLEGYRLALGACSPVLRRDFCKINRVRGFPAPPVAPRSWVP
jgi:hypothetical protein